MASRPPNVDDAAWQALLNAVRTQPTQPRGPWATHSRLSAALADVKDDHALVLAHDRLVLPWRDEAGVWRNLARGVGCPSCVKRFCCVPSLSAWLAHEANLPRECRVYYEVLRERTPCRYWLDFDLDVCEALTLAQLDTDRLARLLERHVLTALHQLTDAAPGELSVVCVDGNGSPGEAHCRVSVHVIAHGALLPNNEHAAAAVRLAVIDSIRAAARAGDDATAAALVRCCPNLESAVDRINTKNRLRRLTGHTKLDQGRWSSPLPRHAGLPPGVFFVSGAAAVGERVLAMRQSMLDAPQAALRERQPHRAAAPAACDVAPAAEAAIRAELRALPALNGCNLDAVRVLPPRGQFPCYTVFTSCPTCPWRAQDSPEGGRTPGASHRSSRLYVTFFPSRLELGCTATRHTQRVPHAYVHAASALALFPDAAARDAASVLAQMEISPVRAAAEASRGKENVMSPFMLQHLDDIFSPRFSVAGS